MTIIFILTNCSSLTTDDRNGTFDLADHMKKVVNIDLPKSIVLIHEYDNAEGQAEALYTIEQKDIKQLIQQYNFSPIDSLLNTDVLTLSKESKGEYLSSYVLKFYKEEKYKLQNYPSMIYFTICKNNNAFRLMVDTNNTLLWLINSYPDMAGDGPECD